MPTHRWADIKRSKLPTLYLGVEGSAVDDLLVLLDAQGYWDLSVTRSEEFDSDVEDAVIYFQQTHQDPDGQMLVADGVVGPRTWWALQNAEGAVQRSGIQATPPAGLGPLRNRVLDVALAEHALDVKEVPGGSNRGPHVDKYLPDFTKKPGEKGPAWCCFFYSWVASTALGTWPLGRREGSCSSARRAAGKLGLWVPRSDVTRGPYPGDAFVMDKGSNGGHIGYVLRVSEDGLRMNTVEGNCGNRVKLGLRYLNDSQIIGFIDNVPSEKPVSFARGVVNAPLVGADTVR